MKHFAGPGHFGWMLLLGMAAGGAFMPVRAAAQGRPLAGWFCESHPLLRYARSQGYLGVDLADVDAPRAQALKLKEVRGAIITLIDHDAPAGKAGLRVNDVVLQLNGQTVESAEQLRRMLRELPAGRKVSLGISRDGNMQTLTVVLANRRTMEHDIWSRLGLKKGFFTHTPDFGMLAEENDQLPGGYLSNGPNVGVLVEPLTSQMAEYLNVPGGLMVKQVARRSEAAKAGLRAFDVILKMGSSAVLTMGDWERMLRVNQGRPVPVTILRDRKQQVLTLQVDSKHRGGVWFNGIDGNIPEKDAAWALEGGDAEGA